MSRPTSYIGIHDDLYGGMTSIGKIIRDAWVFGILPEEESCKGWQLGGIENLIDQVNHEWDKYGCLVSRLPEGLRERHQSIHDEAFRRAKEAGWRGEFETDDEQ